MWNSQYFNHYSKPWIPLWFSSHWRMESKHCTGTELRKALWEEIFHSLGWILLILAILLSTRQRSDETKSCALDGFEIHQSPLVPKGPLWGKVFCPHKYHSTSRGPCLQVHNTVFPNTFPWGKKKSTAIPHCMKSTPLQENNLFLFFQNKSIIQNYYIITKNE